MKNKYVRIIIAAIIATGFVSIITGILLPQMDVFAERGGIEKAAEATVSKVNAAREAPASRDVKNSVSALSSVKNNVVADNKIQDATVTPVQVKKDSQNPASKSAISELPASIEIPKIQVKNPVINVGVTSTGIMDTPNNYVQTGWYSLGTVPGQKGSAVIGAHVDNGGFVPTISGPFKRLRELSSGDEIYIVTNDGSKNKFIVKSVASFKYEDIDTNELFNQSDGAYLKLITCNGKWVPSKKTYDERLIVTAVPA